MLRLATAPAPAKALVVRAEVFSRPFSAQRAGTGRQERRATIPRRVDGEVPAPAPAHAHAHNNAHSIGKQQQQQQQQQHQRAGQLWWYRPWSNSCRLACAEEQRGGAIAPAPALKAAAPLHHHHHHPPELAVALNNHNDAITTNLPRDTAAAARDRFVGRGLQLQLPASGVRFYTTHTRPGAARKTTTATTATTTTATTATTATTTTSRGSAQSRSYATAPPPKMYTTSFAFFEALWDAGVTHCFVNLGSDHPSIIEAMVKGAQDRKGQFPRIITCPNEMVALSMADGYARVTGRPQCVIVHVDVGTQGLGAAVHNASTGRAPVLIFAGLSPFTQEGELRGSRGEYIHWIQDVPDQKQIVSQYCRYAAELKTGVNVKQMVNRALQFARSAPQGPVYLCGAREVMEQDIEPYTLRQEHWQPVELGGLPESGVREIAATLAAAREPLVVTGYAARDHRVPAALVELANAVPGLRVLDTSGSDMSFPADHPGWLGLRFGNDDSVRSADAILVLDCDVPWIPMLCAPKPDARIFHVDIDPLKQMMPLFYVNAEARYRADPLAALNQLTTHLRADAALHAQLTSPEAEARAVALRESHRQKLDGIAARAQPQADGSFGTGHLCSRLRALCPEDTIWSVEAVTNTLFVHDNLQPTRPGQWVNCGGGGLGWSGGGALGIKLASDHEAQKRGEPRGKFVVQVVGDGTFLFSVPGSVYWIARRYNIPVLTIVLNNKGWNAPRRSMLLVHPDGLGSKATNEEINISFDPSPDYAGIAKAASGGELFAARVDKVADLDNVLRQAIDAVQGGQGAVVDCKVVTGC